VTELLSALQEMYGDVNDALRVNDAGIWHATPLPILAAAVDVMAQQSWVQPGDKVLDAGAGDGRVLAALALHFRDWRLTLHGVEFDVELVREARRRLAWLGPAVTIDPGDYLASAPALLRTRDVVLNYPDGSEHALVRCFHAHALPGARLLILSPENQPELGMPPVARVPVRPPQSVVAWSLSSYTR
jgi:hypothetical protein